MSAQCLPSPLPVALRCRHCDGSAAMRVNRRWHSAYPEVACAAIFGVVSVTPETSQYRTSHYRQPSRGLLNSPTTAQKPGFLKRRATTSPTPTERRSRGVDSLHKLFQYLLYQYLMVESGFEAEGIDLPSRHAENLGPRRCWSLPAQVSPSCVPFSARIRPPLLDWFPLRST